MDRRLPRRKHLGSFEAYMRWAAFWDDVKVLLVLIAVGGVVLAALWADLKPAQVPPRVESPPIALTPPGETAVQARNPPPSRVDIPAAVRNADPSPTVTPAGPATPALNAAPRVRTTPRRSRSNPPVPDAAEVVTGCQLALEECGFTPLPPGPKSVYEYEVWIQPARR